MEYRGFVRPKKYKSGNPEVRRAYYSWLNQRSRCYTKTNPHYKYYGARGIKVCYSSREFVSWWLEKIKTFSGKIPTTGRIDHDGHYAFDNIELQDKSENSKERIKRNPHYHLILKPVQMLKHGVVVATYESMVSGEKLTGICATTISHLCSAQPRPRRDGITFRKIKT